MKRTGKVSRQSTALRARAADYRFKVDGVRARVYVSGEGDYRYLTGVVVTPHGYVEVDSGKGYSSWRFIVRGVEYGYSEPRRMTARGLAIVAGRISRRASFSTSEKGAGDK